MQMKVIFPVTLHISGLLFHSYFTELLINGYVSNAKQPHQITEKPKLIHTRTLDVLSDFDCVTHRYASRSIP